MVLDVDVHRHLGTGQRVHDGGLSDDNALVNTVNQQEDKLITWPPTDTDLLSNCGK